MSHSPTHVLTIHWSDGQGPKNQYVTSIELAGPPAITDVWNITRLIDENGVIISIAPSRAAYWTVDLL